MAFIQTNYSENKHDNGYTPIPQGEYEMVIGTPLIKVTKNGAESLTIPLIVRNDIEQACQNRIVFNDNWKRNMGGQYVYDTKNFQYIAEAVGIPEGTPLNTEEDFMDAIKHKVVRVYVKVEHDDTYGDSNSVAPWHYKVSNYPNLNHQFKSKAAGNAQTAQQPLVTDDSDLPF